MAASSALPCPRLAPQPRQLHLAAFDAAMNYSRGALVERCLAVPVVFIPVTYGAQSTSNVMILKQAPTRSRPLLSLGTAANNNKARSLINWNR